MRSVEIRELRTAADMQGLSQEFAALLAERDALKSSLHDELDENLRLRDLGGARPDEGMTAFVERLIAERDALAKDAARYRWMRDVGDSTWMPMGKRPGTNARQIDAAIDAAMEAGNE